MSENRSNSLIFKGVENRNEHFRKIGYSAIYFAATFIFLSYTSHAWSTSNAWDIGLRPLYNYDGMDSLAGTGGWSVYKIAWVYLAPPLWGLVVSLFSIVAFTAIEGRNVHLRTILFWLAVNGFLLYLSYVIMGIISGQDYGSKLFTGFVAYYSWLLWSKGKIYGILIVQLVFSLAYALLFSKGVLQLNYSRVLASKSNGKPVVFFNVFVLPVTIGFVLIALTTFPMDFRYQVIRMGTMMPIALLALLGLALHKAKHIHIVKGGLKPVPLLGLAIMTILLLLSRFWLQLHVEPLW